VVWGGNGLGDGDGVFGQRLTASGVRQGGENLVNAATLGTQHAAAVSMDAVGDALVAWDGYGPGDDQGVFAGLYVLPRVAVSDASITEGDSGSQDVTFTVTLDQPGTWPTSVNWTTVNGTAKAAVDYSAKSGTLTFAPGQTSMTVSIAIKGDTLVEADETFYLNLLNAVNAMIADAQSVGTILNDD
jgi:hypothetical protein